MNTITFAQRLREARLNKGMKQKDLASKIGTVPQTISGYEKIDSPKQPSIDLVIKIAQVLGVSLDWLFGLSDQTPHHKERFETLKDVAEVIDDIVESFGGVIEEETETEVHDYGHEIETVEVIHAKIKFDNADLDSFLKNRIKMKQLLSDGVFDASVYDAWLNGEYSKLEKKTANTDRL